MRASVHCEMVGSVLYPVIYNKKRSAAEILKIYNQKRSALGDSYSSTVSFSSRNSRAAKIIHFDNKKTWAVKILKIYNQKRSALGDSYSLVFRNGRKP